MDEICSNGCQLACAYHSETQQVSNRKRLAKFPEKPRVQWIPTKISISWVAPRWNNGGDSSSLLVYILLTRLRSKEWAMLDETYSLSSEIRRGNLTKSSIFWLLAVNSKGIVAEERFPTTLSPTIEELHRKPARTKTSDTSRKSDGKSFYINQNITEINNTLTATLLLSRGSALETTKDKQTEYFVNWFLESCGIYDDAGECNQPPQHYGPIKASSIGKKVQVTLTNMMYNSLYKVRIEAHDASKKWRHDVKIKTPKCLYPNKMFTRCKNNHSSNPTKPLKWSPNIESLVYNHTLKKVIGDISWMVPVEEETEMRYVVSWQAPGYVGQSSVILTGKVDTYQSYLTLHLEPYFIYKIKVMAIFKTKDGDNKILQSSWLYVNTTVSDTEPTENGLIATDIQVNENSSSERSTLTSVIIGAVCAAVVALTFITFLIVYRRRTTLKNTVITKTTVAKSNSYKSSVTGCKLDYANEPLVITDEWELDPQLLKFSTPLGHGAFGKVITGYYSQRKVAIKVVRDCAPLSYKEDLLAELNLMKRIGKHPNIVAMIGACTLTEPIALIMEYVPYGNLQNFLKRCRSEGQSRKNTEDGYTEMTCSVKDGNGVVHEEVISPVDMLSFARQVAMAMEYMHEKKYLHRDLAARNILLDCNKVIKVCDFGLSRDIYKENHYQKLTSGKLPIKWMAIESLRDRIFTTKSDVWSFGILIWEIVTMGASPYPSIALADLYEELSTGYRMEKPANCSNELYEIMRLTWREKPRDRPGFLRLRLLLENLLAKDRNYLDLDNIDMTLDTDSNSSLTLSCDTL